MAVSPRYTISISLTGVQQLILVGATWCRAHAQGESRHWHGFVNALHACDGSRRNALRRRSVCHRAPSANDVHDHRTVHAVAIPRLLTEECRRFVLGLHADEAIVT